MGLSAWRPSHEGMLHVAGVRRLKSVWERSSPGRKAKPHVKLSNGPLVLPVQWCCVAQARRPAGRRMGASRPFPQLLETAKISTALGRTRESGPGKLVIKRVYTRNRGSPCRHCRYAPMPSPPNGWKPPHGPRGQGRHASMQARRCAQRDQEVLESARAQLRGGTGDRAATAGER